MWYLKNDKGEKLFLLCKENKVGRQSGDIILSEDQSISRKHAVITITQASLSQIPKVFVLDSGSKYGTFLNEDIEVNHSITKNTSIELEEGDKIRFGVQYNTFTLHRQPIKITYSSLEKPLLTQLKNNIAKFGGLISTKWESDCTHLTMSAINITVKVMCALGCGKPIVEPKYWEEFIDAIHNKSSLPDPEKFEPPLKEPSLNPRLISFRPDPQRSKLFYGKTFVFFSPSQYETSFEMIKYSGGRCLKWHEDLVTLEKLKRPGWILIQYLEDSDEYEILSSKLKSNGLRTIPETELSFSILYQSLEKYCNPKFSFVKNLYRTSKKIDHGPILAPETQESTSRMGDLKGVIPETQDCIPETQSSFFSETQIKSVPETQTQENNSPLEKSFQLLKQSFSVTSSPNYSPCKEVISDVEDLEEQRNSKRRKIDTANKPLFLTTHRTKRHHEEDSDSGEETNKSKRKNERETSHLSEKLTKQDTKNTFSRLFDRDSLKNSETSDDFMSFVQKTSKNPSLFDNQNKKRAFFIDSDSDEEREGKTKKMADFMAELENSRRKKQVTDSESEEDIGNYDDFLARKFIEEYPTIEIKESNPSDQADKYYISLGEKTEEIPESKFLDLSSLAINTKEKNAIKNEEDEFDIKISIETIPISQKKSFESPFYNLSSSQTNKNYKLFKKQVLNFA